MLAHYGITRIARQTALDTIGIHCFAALRPNSKTLSSSQGKGLTEAAARASAIMEAVEYAVAETPEIPEIRASATTLRSQGIGIVDPTKYLSDGTSFDESETIFWYSGRGLMTLRPFAVPADLVRLDGHARNLKGLCQNTNGLASGNTETEAIFHGLCELVERDAHSLWLLTSNEAQAATAIDSSAFDDHPAVRRLVEQIKGAGLELRLFDQTTNLGVPVIMAVIGERDGNRRKFAIAAGYGAHPLAHRAAIRALTEAAQTRVTSIAGARDDITPAEYAEPISGAALSLLDGAATGRQAPPNCDGANCAEEFIRVIVRRLMSGGLPEPVVVPLRQCDDGFAVVRILSEDLEDAEVNLHWRPGRRAMQAVADL